MITSINVRETLVVDYVESRDANDGLKDAKGQGFHKPNCLHIVFHIVQA